MRTDNEPLPPPPQLQYSNTHISLLTIIETRNERMCRCGMRRGCAAVATRLECSTLSLISLSLSYHSPDPLPCEQGEEETCNRIPMCDQKKAIRPM